MHSLKKITVLQFKNFIHRQHIDENYYNELLSQILKNIKNEYKKEYNDQKNELNFLIIEPIILRCFKDYFYKELDRIDS